MTNADAQMRQFAKELEREQEEIFGQAIEQATREVATQGLEGVVTHTPVRTGKARGGWYVFTGRSGTGGKRPRDPSGTATIAEGVAIIQQARRFEPITIANDEHHISALEQGHSQQAPQGMVSTTMAEIQSKFWRTN